MKIYHLVSGAVSWTHFLLKDSLLLSPLIQDSRLWYITSVMESTYCKQPKKITIVVCFLFFKWAIPGLFFLYFCLFNTQLTANKCSIYKYFLPMTGFEPQTSGNRSNCSTNWATTIACTYLFTVSLAEKLNGYCPHPLMSRAVWQGFAKFSPSV